MQNFTSAVKWQINVDCNFLAALMDIFVLQLEWSNKHSFCCAYLQF